MSLAQRLRSWSAPPQLGPFMVLAVTAAGVFAVFWGYFNPPAIRVVMFDAGDRTQFAAHKVVVYPDQHLYVVGMADGRVRAIDGRVADSNCKVEYLPDDPRGAERNPNGLPGIYRDPCSGALWSFEGNAISGTDKPLRTPFVTPSLSADGKSQRVMVELVNPGK